MVKNLYVKCFCAWFNNMSTIMPSVLWTHDHSLTISLPLGITA